MDTYGRFRVLHAGRFSSCKSPTADEEADAAHLAMSIRSAIYFQAQVLITIIIAIQSVQATSCTCIIAAEASSANAGVIIAASNHAILPLRKMLLS